MTNTFFFTRSRMPAETGRAALTGIVLLLSLVLVPTASHSQDKPPAGQALELPVRYEELNAVQFPNAVSKGEGTCVIPMGILEKHGPHLPLGTDLIDIREVALRAAKREYTIVFPQYYFGQIYEAQHQPGTVAYSHETVWNLLQETCDELGRNGIKKIILANGHGGNNNFIKYFCQAQLEKPRDYVVILYSPPVDAELESKLKTLRKTEFDGHAGEVESSVMMAVRPDLVNPADAARQSGEDLDRLKEMKSGFSGIWWYAKFPNHYAGDGSAANKEIGELSLESRTTRLAEMIRSVKQDKKALELQKEFQKKAVNPLATEQ